MSEVGCVVFVHRTAFISSTSGATDSGAVDKSDGDRNGGEGRGVSRDVTVAVERKSTPVRTLHPCPNKGLYSLVVRDAGGLYMTVRACFKHARSASRLLALREPNVSALVIVSGVDEAKEDEEERLRALERQDRAHALEMQLDAVKRDNHQLNALVEALQRESEDAKVAVHDAAAQARATITTKTAALQKARAELDDASTKIAELERANEELEKQAERQTKRVAALQKRLTELEPDTE
jgi:hypothetical protein